LIASYLEEKVAVDEPSGVAKSDELHDLGKLQKSRTNLSSYIYSGANPERLLDNQSYASATP
jgi:hypothetical protein